MTDVIGGVPATPANVFFNLDELKEFAGITGDSFNDRLKYVVDGVNAAIHKYLKRRLLSEEHEEFISGHGCFPEMYLREYPVTEIKTLEVFGTPWTAYRLESDQECESNKGLLWSTCAPWPEGLKNIRVVYQAGFTAAPDDLKMAALEIAQEVWRDVKSGKRIASERLGDYSYSLVTNNSVESLVSARRILGSYRRVAA